MYFLWSYQEDSPTALALANFVYEIDLKVNLTFFNLTNIPSPASRGLLSTVICKKKELHCTDTFFNESERSQAKLCF